MDPIVKLFAGRRVVVIVAVPAEPLVTVAAFKDV
ncbi:unannotated protein [freshwater metagenome]|uniref:Unannotated protein n=1 Tax=freshwater metagenome TaxID=449393 RepID=A0A6J6UWA2_9ZZZZ